MNNAGHHENQRLMELNLWGLPEIALPRWWIPISFVIQQQQMWNFSKRICYWRRGNFLMNFLRCRVSCCCYQAGKTSLFFPPRIQEKDYSYIPVLRMGLDPSILGSSSHLWHSKLKRRGRGKEQTSYGCFQETLAGSKSEMLLRSLFKSCCMLIWSTISIRLRSGYSVGNVTSKTLYVYVKN